uniref:Uncharacterized protein n=1 Tax=Anopheles atroparvus TaxID=41427 RepID=A0A182JN24_ANOAO
MKAFIVFSMALALASAVAVDDSKKEKRGLWELGSQQESYETYGYQNQHNQGYYGYENQQNHGYYGNDYVQKEEYVEVPKPYAVHVDKPYPVYVKEPVYVEKQVPVTVHIKEHHKKPFWG